MWLFSSSKKKSLPEVYVSETTAEGFSHVSTGPPRETTTSSYEPPIPPYPSLPYNLIPQNQYTPPRLEPTVVRQPTNPLDSIPFRLSKQLRQNSGHNIDVKLAKDLLDRIRANVESNNYEYDFKLEKSVIQEMDSSGVCKA